MRRGQVTCFEKDSAGEPPTDRPDGHPSAGRAGRPRSSKAAGFSLLLSSRNIVIACLLAGFCLSLQGQRAAQIAPISVRNMRADIEFLSSPPLDGRLSLERGSDVAARFIAAEFEKAGLKPAAGDSYLQEFGLVAPGRAEPAPVLTVTRAGNTAQLSFGRDFRGASVAAIRLKAPLVFAGYGITAPEYHYDDYAGLDAKGKVVLVLDHEPQESDARSVFNGTGHTRHANRRQKLLNARSHGVLALLVASEPNRKHASPFDSRPPLNDGLGPRGSAPPQSLEDDQQAIPSFSISDRAASLVLGGDYLAEWQRAIDASLKPQSRVIDASVEIVSEAPSARRGRSANVAGLLEGNDPRLKNETVLITAHYDHLGAPGTALYPGANDNASGTAAVLELARVFTREARPRRTLLFLVFGSEEEGLLGSYYYADHPLRPLETTRAVLNLDMIARDEAHTPESQGLVDIPADTSNQLDLVGGFYSPELVKEIREAGREAGLDLSEKFDRDHDLNVLFRCDHFPFLLKDVPAIWLFGGFHPGYHRPVDTVEKLNLAKLEKVARLTYLAARRLADTPRPPRFEAAH